MIMASVGRGVAEGHQGNCVSAYLYHLLFYGLAKCRRRASAPASSIILSYVNTQGIEQYNTMMLPIYERNGLDNPMNDLWRLLEYHNP